MIEPIKKDCEVEDVPDKDACSNNDNGYYQCTRLKGHTGNHHAHGGKGVCCHTWKQEKGATQNE